MRRLDWIAADMNGWPTSIWILPFSIALNITSRNFVISTKFVLRAVVFWNVAFSNRGANVAKLQVNCQDQCQWLRG